jgi:DHA1 family tetracycline resistance protein-like MFS transporter
MMQKMPIGGAPTKEKSLSYLPIHLVFFLYSLAFTMIFPALPNLLLSLTSHDSQHASRLYGYAIALKFLFEFYSAPLLGCLSDCLGRRPILFLSLLTIGVELFLLATHPSASILFITRIMAGLGDATVTVTYAIVSDIATVNDDFVTKEFGYIGAVFGFGVVIGPLLGSYLSTRSLSLCFLVGSIIIAIAFAVALCFVIETRPVHLSKVNSELKEGNYIGYQSQEPVDPFSSTALASRKANEQKLKLYGINPFVPLVRFFSNSELRVLSYPFILSHMSSGIHYVWVIYLRERFDATYMDVGLFMTVSGVAIALTQGFLIKSIIPNILSEENATAVCLLLTSIQLFCFGLCPSLMSFYLTAIIFAPASIYGPALKALLSNAGGTSYQGELQGALG